MRPSDPKSSPFKIFNDDTTAGSPSPHGDHLQPGDRSQPQFPTMSEAHDADNSVNSTSEDETIPSIEISNRELSNAYTNSSSISSVLYSENNDTRKHSAAYTTVSSIPPSLPYNSGINPYTPKKGPRAAFRSPSSVRALQMGSPPPFASPRPGGGGPRRYDHYESGMTSSSDSRRYRPETSDSVRSGSIMRQEYVESSQRSHGSVRGALNAYEQQTPQRTGPIVLLHITLLPCSSPEYSAKSMKELAPSYVTENWRLLQEKLTDTVLERGLLISHPGDEFDLLEERVLETLDLCPPRITACGHYYGGDSDSDSGNDSGIADLNINSKQARRLCTAPHEEMEAEDVCHQCEQHMHLPGKGIGAGTRKWNVKIFAANGLMKASAWARAATCSEMERVDVEIEPWMPDDVKRALDARLEEEEEEERRKGDQNELLKLELCEMGKTLHLTESARLRAEERAKATEKMRLQAETAKLHAEERHVKRQEMMLKEAEAAKLQAEECLSKMEALRLEAEAARVRAEQIASEKDEELKRATSAKAEPTEASQMADTMQESVSPAASSKLSKSLSKPASQVKDIRLSTLLYNYLYLLIQDRRNLVLGLLSVLVLVLSYRLAVPQPTGSATPNAALSHNGHGQSTHGSVSSSNSSTESPFMRLSSVGSPAAVSGSSVTESQTTAHIRPFPVRIDPSSSALVTTSAASILRSEVSRAAEHSAPAPRHQLACPIQDSSAKVESHSSTSTAPS